MRRSILFVVVLGLLVTLYLGIRHWMQPPPPPVSVPPSVQLLESKLVGRKDGERQWEILTKSVLQAENLVTLSDMEQITIFQGEKPYLSVQAQGATWDRRQDILHLQGSVVVEGEDDFRLESDLLVWQGAKETLTSPGPVLIFWNGLEIRAAQMILEMPSSLLHLQEDVEIRDGQFHWKLQQAVYDLDQELVDFYGSLILEAEAGDHEEK